MKKWVSASTLALLATTAFFVTVSLAAGQAPAAPPQGRGGGGAGAGARGGGAGRGAAAAQPPAGPFTRTPEGKPDLNGYWGGCCNLGLQDLETQRGIIVDPSPAKIPYNAEYAAKAKDLRANHMFEEPGLHCLLEGVPFQMYTQFGFQIMASPKHMLFTWDFMNANRVIPLDGRPHIPASIKLFMGDPVGHWEGDVLVVETTNLNDRSWLDAVGHLHSDAIHVVERFTPVDANTIRYEATVDDPKAFTQPLKLQETFRRNTKAGYEQLEFACIEYGHTDLEHYTEAAGAPPKDK